jgi:hypothetical protein
MKIRIDIPHALFLCAIAGSVIWYFLDARAASDDIQNLGLIGPVSAAIVVLCALSLRETIRIEAGPTRSPLRPALPWRFAFRIMGTMALLGAYVLSMDHLGFDLATWLYITATLAFLGERRWWMLGLVPLLVAAFVVYAFASILQTPIPLLLGGAG